MRLSVLDQSPVSEGSTGSRALRNTLDLAIRSDELGYHRYWLAEHHGGPMLAGTSPEVLIGPIASATARLRVGSGGVLLPHYSPFKVAEAFSALSGLFPGRIDLGIGRASGADAMTTFALQRERRHPGADDFPQQLAELLSYLDGTIVPDHPFAPLAGVLPGRPERPQPWLLGSSQDSAIWAAQVGLPYAFGDFINPMGAELARLYRQRFAPSQEVSEPRVAIAVWVLCAETDEEAQRLATSSRMASIAEREGRVIPVPSVETAQRFLAARGDRGPAAAMPRRRRVIGAPAAVRSEIEHVAELYGAEEVIVVTITHDHRARVRSYELLAEAFGLSGADGGTDPWPMASKYRGNPRACLPSTTAGSRASGPPMKEQEMDEAPVEVTQKHIDGIAWPASKEEVLGALRQNGAPDDVLQAVGSANKERFVGPNDLHAILWKAA